MDSAQMLEEIERLESELLAEGVERDRLSAALDSACSIVANCASLGIRRSWGNPCTVEDWRESLLAKVPDNRKWGAR